MQGEEQKCQKRETSFSFEFHLKNIFTLYQQFILKG